jgi:YVTN family beta-propeller protein
MRRERVYVRRRRVAATILLGLIALVTWGVSSVFTGGEDLEPNTRTTSVGSSAARTLVEAHGPGSNVYAATEDPSALSPAVRGIPERVYVPNSESRTVDVIDPTTFKIIRHFPAARYDQHVTPSWDMKHLYVDNTGANTLTEIDPRTARPVRTIPVPDPYNLYFTPDGSKAVVVVESFHRLDFRNPRNWRLIKTVVIPSPGPDHLDFSWNGRFLLLSTEFGGHVVRVDTVAMRVTGSLYLGGSPVDVKLSPNGRVFFVANQQEGGVSVIDPRGKMRQTRFIRTGAGAHGLAYSRDTQDLYVSNRLAGSISVIDVRTQRVRATWHVGGSPDMMQVSPDGGQLWVSNRFHGSVSVINTATGHLLQVIPVGASPHGLTFFPQPGRYCLGHNGVYR